MSEAGHRWDTAGTNTGKLVPSEQNSKPAVGQLKTLAQKVLNRFVPLSHSLPMGQVGQSTEAPTDSVTALGQQRDSDELSESMKRLESAGICIAIWDDGEMRVVTTETDTVAAIDDGGTIYSPADMLMYVTLSERERRMLHSFKKPRKVNERT